MIKYLAGVDEVGRGCIAGPVIAAAVILGKKKINGLNDSKQVSANKRIVLAETIKERAFKYCFGLASVEEIDSMNIRQASLLAMKRAIIGLKLKNLHLIIDGVDIPEVKYPCRALIKADTKIPEVMAASIIAKVYRDNLMKEYGKIYPNFLFEKNKGYPTKAHLNILKSLGSTKEHRKSFKPVIDVT